MWGTGAGGWAVAMPFGKHKGKPVREVDREYPVWLLGSGMELAGEPRREIDWSKSIADYTEAIRLDPKDAKAYHSRGVAYREKGDLNKAAVDFAHAKELGVEE